MVQTGFREYYNYIKKDSPQGATKVRQAILEAIDLLPSNPEMYAKDRFSNEENGNVRAFTKYSYRVTYKIKDELIIIAKITHTSQEP